MSGTEGCARSVRNPRAMKYEDLTGKIIDTCHEVAKELRPGFVESVYEKALVIALQENGLHAQSQVPLQVHFRGRVVGEFVADIIVGGKVMLELKAVKELAREHHAQLINYLNATRVEVGLLINFGTHRPEVKRCWRPKRRPEGQPT